MKPIATLFAAALLVAGAVAAYDLAAASAGEGDTQTADKKSRAETKEDAKSETKEQKKPERPFKTKKENYGYAVGMNVGMRVYTTLARQFSYIEVDRKALAKTLTIKKKTIESIQDDGIPVDPKRLTEGFQDAVSGAKPKMTVPQLTSVLQEANKLAQAGQKERIAKLMAKQKKAAAKALKDGKAFLAKNKQKKGIKTTKSGLQYEVVKKGTGKMPKAADTVTVHYTGKLRSGKVFDTSRNGKPATFPVNGVIPGWTEALQMMKAGAKWKLYIPAELAYGERGSRGAIGPNEVLIFDVELIGVKSSPDKPKEK